MVGSPFVLDPSRCIGSGALPGVSRRPTTCGSSRPTSPSAVASPSRRTERDRSRSPPRGLRPYDIFTPQLRAQVDARTSRTRDRPEPDPEPEPGEDLHRRAQHLRAAAALWDIFDSDPRQARHTRVGRWDQEDALTWRCLRESL